MRTQQKIWTEEAQLVMAFGARAMLEAKCELYNQTMTITTFSEA